jgi:Interferon-induced transmembrane protein
MSSSERRYPPPPPPSPQQAGGSQQGVPVPQQAQTPQGPSQGAVKPSAYWPLTIISFLCFFIVGAIGMYFSAQVSSRWNEGNVEGARQASKTALILGIVGIAVGVLVFASLSSEGSY